jgi:hypothetical protein
VQFFSGVYLNIKDYFDGLIASYEAKIHCCMTQCALRMYIYKDQYNLLEVINVLIV